MAWPSFSRHIAELIGNNARSRKFPLVGHGHNVRHFSPCASRIVADFIDNPGPLPDSSCADRRPQIRFVSSAQIP
jgi:hypothetical protein